jgi:hypothetical protein
MLVLTRYEEYDEEYTMAVVAIGSSVESLQRRAERNHQSSNTNFRWKADRGGWYLQVEEPLVALSYYAIELVEVVE